MKPIKEIAIKAAEILIFENVQEIPMVEITIAAKGQQPNYNIKVPKAFIEEIYKMGIEEGKIVVNG
jgi:hypothetical protein